MTNQQNTLAVAEVQEHQDSANPPPSVPALQKRIFRNVREPERGTAECVLGIRGVPLEHRTDRLTAAVNNLADARECQKLFQHLNAGRRNGYLEELSRLQPLPERRLDTMRRERVRISQLGDGSFETTY
jgi:hypothetical protein